MLKNQDTIQEQNVSFQTEVGKFEVSLSTFSDTNVIFSKSELVKKYSFPSERKDPMLMMFFSVEGNFKSFSQADGQYLTLSTNQHVLSFTDSFDGSYSIQGRKSDSLCIGMSDTFFQRFIDTDNEILLRFWDEAFSKKVSTLTPVPLPITTVHRSLITSLKNCPFTGHMKKLFFESKIVELFLSQVNQAQQLRMSKAYVSHKIDVDKFYSAREFVSNHMLEPFSLREVAMHSGLNDYKLKRGFKELFGTTVFGYLNELKMSYAKNELLNSSYLVSEIAYTLGYNDPYSFTKAFKKHFGYLPSDVAYRRK